MDTPEITGRMRRWRHRLFVGRFRLQCLDDLINTLNLITANCGGGDIFLHVVNWSSNTFRQYLCRELLDPIVTVSILTFRLWNKTANWISVGQRCSQTIWTKNFYQLKTLLDEFSIIIIIIIILIIIITIIIIIIIIIIQMNISPRPSNSIIHPWNMDVNRSWDNFKVLWWHFLHE